MLREKFPGDEGYFELIYLDPPFNSNRSYNVLFKEGLEDSPAQINAFEDSWHWTVDTRNQFEELVTNWKTVGKISDLMLGLEKIVGHNDMLAYLTMMSIRLIELHRVLKPNGSLYLHCDPTASHYLKIILDTIFGHQGFRNEIIWHYSGWNAKLNNSFNSRHDVILFYGKSNAQKFNSYSKPWESEAEYIKIRKQKVHTDETGKKYVMSDAGGGKRVRRYLEEAMSYGRPVDDVWDIDKINNSSKEALGFPTQKPEALIERIIKASSNEGDWILDPFGGCGTTVAVAERLNRNWVMIDITTLAINLVRRRLENMFPELALSMTVQGLPEDLSGAKTLFETDPFAFEYWCCDLVQARPAGSKTKEKMHGADKGIDGIIVFPDQKENLGDTEYRKILVQVKGGHVSAPQIRDFWGTIEREKAAGGIFITLHDASQPMKHEAIEMGDYVYNLTGQKFPKIQIISVEDLLNGYRPDHPSVIPYNKKAEKAKEDLQKPLF